ncbi:hypothetical protein [Micromonospora sp. KC723]|nr:hypothetical protein [Micromonospora sp. KC723]
MTEPVESAPEFHTDECAADPYPAFAQPPPFRGLLELPVRFGA